MTHSKWIGMMALTAALLCSACAEKTSTATLITPTSQQMATIKWDEVVAASTTVKVSNASLVAMR